MPTPRLFALAWGVKLLLSVGLSALGAGPQARSVGLYTATALELLLSVAVATQCDHLAAKIDATSPALTSRFETATYATQAGARALLDRVFDDAPSTPVLVLLWLATVGAAHTLNGSDGAIALGVAWACANGVLDAVWHIARRRSDLVALKVDAVALHVASLRFTVAVALIAHDVWRRSVAATVTARGVRRGFVLVCAQLAPVAVYAAAIALSHRGLDMYLGLAFALRVPFDAILDRAAPRFGPKRAMLYIVSAAVLSTAAAFVSLCAASQALLLGAVLTAVVVDRCSDAVAVYVGGPLLRRAQRPPYVLAVYFIKATFGVSGLRLRLKDDPNAVLDVLLGWFTGTVPAALWALSACAWCVLAGMLARDRGVGRDKHTKLL